MNIFPESTLDFLKTASEGGGGRGRGVAKGVPKSHHNVVCGPDTKLTKFSELCLSSPQGNIVNVGMLQLIVDDDKELSRIQWFVCW